jgi:non-lysosomal glucosylceramidase
MKTNNNFSRRNFIKQTSLASVGLSALNAVPSWASEILAAPKSVTTNKGFNANWIKSLYERGTVTTYLKSKNELKYIGMPVGGINAGGLYIGGDGRLWLWDIFNLNQEGINPLDVPWGNSVQSGKRIRSRDGSSYIAPQRQTKFVHWTKVLPLR